MEVEDDGIPQDSYIILVHLLIPLLEENIKRTFSLAIDVGQEAKYWSKELAVLVKLRQLNKKCDQIIMERLHQIGQYPCDICHKNFPPYLVIPTSLSGPLMTDDDTIIYCFCCFPRYAEWLTKDNMAEFLFTTRKDWKKERSRLRRKMLSLQD